MADFPPNVTEIVASFLSKKGYDGLLADDCECACLLADLMPCQSEGLGSCTAGWKIATNPADCGCGNGCDWHVTLNKPTRDDGDRE